MIHYNAGYRYVKEYRIQDTRYRKQVRENRVEYRISCAGKFI